MTVDGWTRRRVLFGAGSLAAVAAAGAAGAGLVSRGDLPGRQYLNWLDGACQVRVPPMRFGRPGPQYSGTFFSRARRRSVGWTIAYPPGHRPGARLPLVIGLHGYGGNHASVFGRLSPAQVLALRVGGAPLAPMALVTVDGGGGYWNPHPGDDPMGMVTGELLPRCQRLGLGLAHPVGAVGVSMGGYGALLLAEKCPGLLRAAAAISPAIWTSYAQAHAANPGAYASAAAFASADAVTQAGGLATVAVRVAAGVSDPFIPGVRALARVLPPTAVVDIGHGCHGGPFAAAQVPPSIAFLAGHLAA